MKLFILILVLLSLQLNIFCKHMENEKTQAPLCTALWGQIYPYNFYCPLLSGEPTVVHCGATAQAIIMHYYKHPVTGEGSHTYSWEGQTLTADFGNSVYDWSQMPNTAEEVVSENQLHEVAQISYHCGIAQYVYYGIYASYSTANWKQSIKNAFRDNFRYNTSDSWLERANFEDEEWYTIIKNEIDNDRPVFCMSPGNGGHFYIIDGYDNNLFHVNWGWNGYMDGLYDLNNLTPSNFNFTDGLTILTGIEPDWGETPLVKFVQSEINLTLALNTNYDKALTIENNGTYSFYYKAELELDGSDDWCTFSEKSDGIVINGDQSTTNLQFDTTGYQIGDILNGEIVLYSANLEVDRIPVSVTVSIVDINESIVKNNEILKSYPNPFNPETTITLELTENSYITVEIINTKGELVRKLFSGNCNKGYNYFNFNGNGLNNGVYYCRVKDQNSYSTIKLLLVK
ncbi:MAG: C10 family peptidase [Candidatus Delongbacteria bacterium]|nr:C10 family peptidase [Candidatus Delongbacteria bacterium]MBN2833658.1 C10 family peptidase [Candidatus Delongbacteria bacterium]